jgi:hypothetical protein
MYRLLRSIEDSEPLEDLAPVRCWDSGEGSGVGWKSRLRDWGEEGVGVGDGDGDGVGVGELEDEDFGGGCEAK